MRQIKLNIRLVAFLAALVVAVVAAGSLAPGARPAYALTDITDPSGVFCADLTVLGVNGIILARFNYFPGEDQDDEQDGLQDTTITAVPYVPELLATCQTPQSTISSAPANQTAERPSLAGTWNQATDTIEGSVCSEDVEFGPVTFIGFTKITIDFELTHPDDGKSIDANAFEFDNPPYTDDTCTDTTTGGLGLIVVEVNGRYLPGEGPGNPAMTSDWDKDGRSDWDELALNNGEPGGLYTFTPLLCDPFVANDACAISVGGIAELPAAAGASPDAAASSDNNAGVIAAAAAATAAGALALGSAAAYARRRSDR